jgi:hypothetical protein
MDAVLPEKFGEILSRQAISEWRPDEQLEEMVPGR